MRASMRFVVAGVCAVLVNACEEPPMGPGTGHLVIEVTTIGKDLDPDGYTLRLNETLRHIDATTSLEFPVLQAGSHVIDLGGLSPNCTIVEGNRARVELQRGGTETVRFTVTCAAYFGDVLVSASSSGADIDPSGYLLVFDTNEELQLPTDGEVTIDRVPAGPHSVEFRGVAPNCAVNGANPIIFGTQPEVTTHLEFAITCVALARVRVVAVTSGVDLDPNGYLLTVREESGVTLPVNGERLIPIAPGPATVDISGLAPNCEVTGSASQTVTVVSELTVDVRFDIVCVPVTRIAFAMSVGGRSQLYSINANATGTTQLTFSSASDAEPTWSPDGSKIAFRSDRDGNSEIYVMSSSGGPATRLTNHGGADYAPAWSPDGARIAFVSQRDDLAGEIYVMNSDGTNVVRLTTSAGVDAEPAWSPDGSRIAFRRDLLGQGDIHVMNADGSNVVRLTGSAYFDGNPTWSPDGTRIAFTHAVICNNDYYYYYDSCNTVQVMNADGTNAKQVGNSLGVLQPTWSPDGQWLAYAVAYCDYYSCINGLEVAKLDGSRRLELVTGFVANPAWRR